MRGIPSGRIQSIFLPGGESLIPKFCTHNQPLQLFNANSQQFEKAPTSATLTDMSLPESGFLEFKKLTLLDIFSGCGGLSEGIGQALFGLIGHKIAVEADEMAAKAFQENNPEAKVIQEDCREVLEKAKAEAEGNFLYREYPARGEVDIICGGPPCQVGNKRIKWLNSIFRDSVR